MSRIKRRQGRGKYRNDSLKWAARLHGRSVRLEETAYLISIRLDGTAIQGTAVAVMKYGRALIEVRGNQDVLDRLAGREESEVAQIEYRDRGKLSFAKGERADLPFPPELARLARFWEKNETLKQNK